MKILIFAKEKPGLKNALEFTKLLTKEVFIFKGALGDRFPKEAVELNPDLTISYVSPWIVPIEILNKTKKFAINFHPGPPEYPGIGCTNFALYENASEFGVTAHLMEEKVDSGKIINVKRFPIYPSDTVYSLTMRCYDYILIQYYEVLNHIISYGNLPKAKEEWKRKPITRKQLNELCEIKPDMDNTEINRRVRAVTYPGMPGAYISIYGNIFIYSED